MEIEAKLTGKDWPAILWIGLTQVSVAWFMTLMDLVYAPIPMFAAAVVAGFLFKGQPKKASLGAALAGLMGGWLAEWAYHTVRIQNRIMNWSQLDSNEQLGLAVAEMLLYAALLSFFSAFFSWGTSSSSTEPEQTTEEIEPTEPHFSPAESDQPAVDVPFFKQEDENQDDDEKPLDESSSEEEK